jgi:hypothetical protein
VFEVRSQDSSAEFRDIGNYEARSKFRPAYKLGRFWIDNHPGERRSESAIGTLKGNSVLVEFCDEVIRCDGFSAERAGLRHGFQRIFFASTVAPAVRGTSGDGVSVRNIHFVESGPTGGDTTLPSDRFLVRR